MAVVQLFATALLAFVHFSIAAEICCGTSGCFDDRPPFDNFPLPDCPPDFDLVYSMYTRSNRNIGETFTATSAVPSVYSGSRRTVFIIHGFSTNGNFPWISEMKDAYLDKEDINAVILDWGGGAQILDYTKAASNTRSVGAYTALVFQNLLEASGSSASRFWCVGHSLGSHVCGHTGMRMPTLNKLGRITGMDPAGPLFQNNPDLDVGLNPSCATFVDVIHSDTEFGTERPLGHIDFYPSGGRDQPGCGVHRDIIDSAEDNIHAIWDADNAKDICSHSRAYQFMTESIKDDCFRANEECNNYANLPGSCSSCSGCGAFPCAFMGYGADSSCKRSGLFYLTVRANVPYCNN
jgi:hypothetical protein